MAAEKLSRRREEKLDYTVFAEPMLKAEKEGVLDTKDLLSNMPLLDVGGSETTYYMLTMPRMYKRLVKEIREKFKQHDEVTLHRTAKLKYLPSRHGGVHALVPASEQQPSAPRSAWGRHSGGTVHPRTDARWHSALG
jgi:hypothetical protein